jgi:hypothetical protein
MLYRKLLSSWEGHGLSAALIGRCLLKMELNSDAVVGRNKSLWTQVRKESVEKCGAKNFRTLLSLTIFRPTFFDRKHCSGIRTFFWGHSTLEVDWLQQSVPAIFSASRGKPQQRATRIDHWELISAWQLQRGHYHISMN